MDMDVFEGNTYEGHTLIPFLEKISSRFNLGKPVVVADAGLLSRRNIEALKALEYEYIIGARLKSEPDKIKQRILQKNWNEGETLTIKKDDDSRLIVAYTIARANKDAKNRLRGLKRLERMVNKGKFTKANINNRGYNKYLRLNGNVSIEIDYDKFEQDRKWMDSRLRYQYQPREKTGY